MSAMCKLLKDFDKMQREKALKNTTTAGLPQASKENSSGLRILRITDPKTGKVDYEDKDSPKQL